MGRAERHGGMNSSKVHVSSPALYSISRLCSRAWMVVAGRGSEERNHAQVRAPELFLCFVRFLCLVRVGAGALWHCTVTTLATKHAFMHAVGADLGARESFMRLRGIHSRSRDVASHRAVAVMSAQYFRTCAT